MLSIHWRIQAGVGTPPPPPPHPPRRPNSFDFMQFSGKFGKIVCCRPLGSLRPPSGKSWIRHCNVMHIFRYSTKPHKILVAYECPNSSQQLQFLSKTLCACGLYSLNLEINSALNTRNLCFYVNYQCAKRSLKFFFQKFVCLYTLPPTSIQTLPFFMELFRNFLVGNPQIYHRLE